MSPISETEIFNLVVPRNNNSEVLLHIDGGKQSLPQVEIPKGKRVAELLTKRVKEDWGLETVCLFDPKWEDVGSSNWGLHCQVLESRDPNWTPTAKLRWMKRSTDQLRILDRSLKLADAFNSDTRPGPFGKAGWMDELMAWMQPHLRPINLTLTGRFEQLNASPFFSLIRFETNASAVWFKAIGEPNLHEYAITLGLAEDHPHYLPKIIAAKPEWNGWLMLEAGGEGFNQCTELEQWQRVAETLAHLQIECVGQARRLLEIGCKDLRIATIIQRIDLFLDCMDRLMQEQPSEPPRRLNRLELKEIGSALKDAFRCMGQTGISDSLIHGDFNPGNVVVNPKNCVFLDWAEGSVGPPFLTLEYLIEFLRRTHIGIHQYENRLRHAYACCWLRVWSEQQICEAMRIAPSLAVFYYALGSQAWEDPDLMNVSGIARYLRALTRRLQKELRAINAPGTSRRAAGFLPKNQSEDSKFSVEGA